MPPGVPNIPVIFVHGESAAPAMRMCFIPTFFSICAASSRGVIGVFNLILTLSNLPMYSTSPSSFMYFISPSQIISFGALCG